MQYRVGTFSKLFLRGVLSQVLCQVKSKQASFLYSLWGKHGFFVISFEEIIPEPCHLVMCCLEALEIE